MYAKGGNVSNDTALTAEGGRSSGVFGFLGKLLGGRPPYPVSNGEESEQPRIESSDSDNRPEEQIPPFPDPVVGEEQTPVVRTLTAPKQDDLETTSLPQGPAVLEVKELPTRASSSSSASVLSIEEEDLHSVLFKALQQAEPIKQDFRVGELIHDLFDEEELLSRIARQLATSYADGEKKIGAVVGMGIYGDRLARAMKKYLPPIAGVEEHHQEVHSFPLDQCCQNGQNVWRFASDNRVGQKLRAKRVLVVLPVLTKTTSDDVETCIRHIEDHLGTNTTVFGVVTVFALNPKKAISRTRGKPLVVNSLLTLGFSW